MNTQNKTAGETANYKFYFNVIKRADGTYTIKFRGTNQTVETGSLLNNSIKKAEGFKTVEEAQKWIDANKTNINNMKWVCGSNKLYEEFLKS